MIQRKQTLYLLVAAILMAMTLFMPLATFFGQSQILSCEITLTGFEATDTTLPDAPQTVMHVTYLTILLGLSTLLPLVIIFLYKKRFLQVRLCFTETVLLLGSQGFIAYYVYNLYRSFEVISWKFGIPSIFPILALVFIVLAIRGIVNDEKLVKSLNRIR